MRARAPPSGACPKHFVRAVLKPGQLARSRLSRVRVRVRVCLCASLCGLAVCVCACVRASVSMSSNPTCRKARSSEGRVFPKLECGRSEPSPGIVRLRGASQTAPPPDFLAARKLLRFIWRVSRAIGRGVSWEGGGQDSERSRVPEAGAASKLGARCPESRSSATSARRRGFESS